MSNCNVLIAARADDPQNMTYVVSGQGSETDISITEAMINGNEAFTHDLMQHTPSHCERMLALAQELNTITMEAV